MVSVASIQSNLGHCYQEVRRRQRWCSWVSLVRVMKQDDLFRRRKAFYSAWLLHLAVALILTHALADFRLHVTFRIDGTRRPKKQRRLSRNSRSWRFCWHWGLRGFLMHRLMPGRRSRTSPQEGQLLQSSPKLCILAFAIPDED